jgi:hypothetical protein
MKRRNPHVRWRLIKGRWVATVTNTTTARVELADDGAPLDHETVARIEAELQSWAKAVDEIIDVFNTKAMEFREKRRAKAGTVGL